MLNTLKLNIIMLNMVMLSVVALAVLCTVNKPPGVCTIKLPDP